MKSGTRETVLVCVELFGHARTVAGVREVQVDLPVESGLSDLAAALSEATPGLVSTALREDGSGLLTSYTANLNGLTFLGSGLVQISAGDRIYLFSSQAGG